MKTVFKIFVTGILIATVGVSAVSAAERIKSAAFNSNKVVLNDTALNLGGQRMISVVKDGEVNASNYMPVRGVLESMGYTVDWDAAQNAVIVTSPLYGKSRPMPPDMNGTIEPTKELLNGCWVAVDFGYGFYYDQGEVFKFYFGADKEFAVYNYDEHWEEEEYISGSYSLKGDMLTVSMTYEGYEEEQDAEEEDAIECRFSKDGSRMYLIDSYSDEILTFVKDDGAEFAGKVDGFKTKGIKSAVYNTNKVILDGKELDLGGQPMIWVVKEGEQNASNFMPVRGVLQAMGYTVDWDGDKQTVIVSGTTDSKFNANETIAPTKELLDGYWTAIAVGFGDDYYGYDYPNDVVKYYFDIDGKVAYYAEFDGKNGYAGGTYSISNDMLSLTFTYITYIDDDGEQVIEDDATVITLPFRFSEDGSQMFTMDVDYEDVYITFVKDAGEEFKKFQ